MGLASKLWSAMTCDGNPQLLKEKWVILHHTADKHDWDSTMLRSTGSLKLNVAMKFTLQTKDYSTTCIKRANNTAFVS